MKEYIKPERIETLVVICFHIVQTWLNKLGFVYKEICKDGFINGHKQSNMIKNHNCFLTKIEKLKPYIVEFNKDGVMKAKNYLVDCIVRGNKHYSIIIITYDECTFSMNDGI